MITGLSYGSWVERYVQPLRSLRGHMTFKPAQWDHAMGMYAETGFLEYMIRNSQTPP